MSQTQYAFLSKTAVPTRKAWQSSIDDLNFCVRLKLDPELQPFADEGFSPCIWGNTKDDVGFEIFYAPSKEMVGENRKIAEFIGVRDYCISMCWRGKIKDCAAVMIACCALMKDFDAVISYEGEEPIILEKLIADTEKVVAEALHDQ